MNNIEVKPPLWKSLKIQKSLHSTSEKMLQSKISHQDLFYSHSEYNNLAQKQEGGKRERQGVSDSHCPEKDEEIGIIFCSGVISEENQIHNSKVLKPDCNPETAQRNISQILTEDQNFMKYNESNITDKYVLICKHLKKQILLLQDQYLQTRQEICRQSKNYRLFIESLMKVFGVCRREFSEATPSFVSEEHSSPFLLQQKLQQLEEFMKNEDKKIKSKQVHALNYNFSFNHQAKNQPITSLKNNCSEIEKMGNPRAINYLPPISNNNSSEEREMLIEELEVKIKILNDQNERLEVENEEMHERIFDFEQKIAQIKLEIDKQVEDKIQEISNSFKTEMYEKETMFTQLQKQMEEKIEETETKDQEISSLKKQIVLKNQTIEEMNHKIAQISTQSPETNQKFKSSKMQHNLNQFSSHNKKINDQIRQSKRFCSLGMGIIEEEENIKKGISLKTKLRNLDRIMSKTDEILQNSRSYEKESFHLQSPLSSRLKQSELNIRSAQGISYQNSLNGSRLQTIGEKLQLLRSQIKRQINKKHE